MYDVLIIGAGPSGLTAAYELSKTGKKVLIVEKKPNVGGLAETKIFESFKYDIGPHRFFTKNQEINKLFIDMLGKDAVEVERFTRILFKNKYFNYPLTPLNALFGLGFIETFTTASSYLLARLKSNLNLSNINNFEDWVVDKFGKKLYSNFFKNYTEKVWGISCKEIGADWASQRIKGLSLMTALKFAIFPNSKDKPKTLINKFYYPRLGAGMLWEKFENYLINNNIEIIKKTTVIQVKEQENHFLVICSNKKNKNLKIKCKNIFFSSPLLQFIEIFDTEKPPEVTVALKKLSYRHHISVHITIDQKLFYDNWIYIHSPDLKLARIADFSNFSKEMSPEGTYPLTLEYFCFEEDAIWNQDDEYIISFALNELRSIFNLSFNVLHTAVTKNFNAYPVIRTGYQEHLDKIKNWLKLYSTITPIGRSGMFKYNNQDHAMATGIYAARKLMGVQNFDPWLVNVDGEYHEELTE